MIPPDKKLCTKCRDWKHKSKFPKVKNKLKDGTYSLIISSHCYQCKSEYSRKWRKRKQEEGTYNSLARKYRQNEINKDPKAFYKKKRKRDKEYKLKNHEKIKRQQRERLAIKRREEGKPIRGGWLKYREEKKSNQTLLPLEPIQEYLKETNLEVQQIAELTRKKTSSINSIIKGKNSNGNKKNTISEKLVDEILIALGEPYKFEELYPLENNE